MGFKGIDFFRKIHSDIESQSASGGIFTILSVLVNYFTIFKDRSLFILYRNSIVYESRYLEIYGSRPLPWRTSPSQYRYFIFKFPLWR